MANHKKFNEVAVINLRIEKADREKLSKNVTARMESGENKTEAGLQLIGANDFILNALRKDKLI